MTLKHVLRRQVPRMARFSYSPNNPNNRSERIKQSTTARQSRLTAHCSGTQTPTSLLLDLPRATRPKMAGAFPASLAHMVAIKPFHRTWAGTYFCYPALYLQPSTVEDIQEIVRAAHAQRRTVMVVGSGHSPSDLTMTRDWLVNLDRFNKVLGTIPEPSGSGLYTDVKVEGGIRIFQLNEYLKTQGLALQSLGSISDQSIAGIISTGTHGSSAYHGLVSQQVVEITAVTGEGELVTCSQYKNAEYFRGLLLSLGKLGIIVHVTVRTVPRFQLESKQEIVAFDRLLDIWDTVWTSSEFIRIWWFPYARRCVLWRANKTTKPITAARTSWYGTWLGRLFYESLLFLAVHLYPRLTPSIEKFVFSRQYGMTETYGKSDDVAVQESVEGFNMDCLFSQFVNEWACPLEDGTEILRDLEAEIFDAARTGDFFVHAPIEVRCCNTSTDDVAKEPSLEGRNSLSRGAVFGNNLKPLLDYTPMLPGTDDWNSVTNANLTLVINATMYRPFGTNCKIGKWFETFEGIMAENGGKPHWAKNFIGALPKEEAVSKTATSAKDYDMKGLKPFMEDWYEEDLDSFKQLRAKYDPNDVLLSGKEWAVRNGIVD